MMIFRNPIGPLVSYDNNILHVENIHSGVMIEWRMSRVDMLKFGVRCVLASLARPFVREPMR